MSNTLYLETDEDITSAVEKLKNSSASAVSIVVPKRSTLLQSMINLKLLKKAADSAKKDLVLVTTDRLSSHLAGRVGLAVADKLGADAKVPEMQMDEPDQTEVIDGGVAETGELEPTEAESASKKSKAEAEVAEDTAVAEATEPVMKTKALADEPKPEKTKAAKVPDFNTLQKRILWVGLALVVIIGLFVANYLIASASVTVYAKGNQVAVAAPLTLDPSASATSITTGVLKAQDLTSTKNLSEQVPATGTQDVGTKATGSMTISNSLDQNSHTLAAGTQFTASGKVFASTTATTVPGATVCSGHVCPGTVTVNVQADQAGDSYNLAPTSYTISGQSQLTAQGGQMTGGTSKTVTVVQQSDVDKAVADMLSKDKDGATQDLQGKAPKSYQFISETLTQTPSATTSDTAVGAQAANVNVKVTASYDALAVSSDDLSSFLKAQAAKQVGPTNQVYDDGAGAAKFSVVKKNPNGSQSLTVTTTASAGAKLDVAAIATQIKGKKYGDATDLISKLPGVDHSDINISPGWSTSLPGRTSRIKVNVKVVTSGG